MRQSHAVLFSWNNIMVERAWIIGSIVLVAALVFIVCALASLVATRGLSLLIGKAGKGAAKNAAPAEALKKTS